MTIHTEDQLQEPQAEPKATPAKRPARTAKNAPAGESQPKPRPASKKPQRAQPEQVQESASGRIRADIICYSTPRRICGRTAAPPFLLCAVCLRRHQKAS